MVMLEKVKADLFSVGEWADFGWPLLFYHVLHQYTKYDKRTESKQLWMVLLTQKTKWSLCSRT